MDISVIIPAYNAAGTIKRSIESIYAARHHLEIEILIVDDASTDNTWAVLTELADKYSDLTILKNQRKKGPSGARNTGLDQARGEYIAFLDADDIWLEDHLVEGHRFLGSSSCDLIIFNQDIVLHETNAKISTWFDEKKIIQRLVKEQISDKEFWLKGNIAQALVEESFLHVQATMLRAASIGDVRFDESVFRSEDMDFGVQLHLKGCKFACSYKTTGIYYQYEHSLSSRSFENDLKSGRDKILMLRKYSQDIRKYNLDKKTLSDVIRDKTVTVAYAQRKLGQPREAIDSVISGLKYRISLKLIVELLKSYVHFLLPAKG